MGLNDWFCGYETSQMYEGDCVYLPTLALTAVATENANEAENLGSIGVTASMRVKTFWRTPPLSVSRPNFCETWA